MGDFSEKLKQSLPGLPIVALDVPGNGDLNEEKSKLNIHDVSEFLHQCMQQRYGKNYKVAIVSISMGAMVALDWANSFRQHVLAITLINTSVAGYLPFYRRLKSQNYYKILKALFSGIEQRERLILEMTSNQKIIPERLDERVNIAKSAPVKRINFIRQLISAARFKICKQPDVAIQILYSKNDNLVDPKCSMVLAKEWGVEVAETCDGGHDLTLDNPDWVLQQFLIFYKGLN
ncbi:alpha/beta hydrolase [Catenovulum sediminis]|uniref:alpha/beta hydrolase n=1 Tax=Catenovulum sediminis TaxID=1740262 RepID=UPI00117E852A|nr:alpha/beta hydrolase [Catenovulum sediminis]